MKDSTILFVHGTGVRGSDFEKTIAIVRSKAKDNGYPGAVQECLWGEIYGIDFPALSLPQPPQRTAAEQLEAEHWDYLELDPLFDLRLWSQESSSGLEANPGEQAWSDLVSTYQPSDDLKELLQAEQLAPLFQPAWSTLIETGVPEAAFLAAGDEASVVSRVFAEAVVAQMMHNADGTAIPVNVRQRLVFRLTRDWDITTKGVKDLFLNIFGHVTKTVLRPIRAQLSQAIAPAIGDILHYQAEGENIRAFIKKKVAAINGNVVVLAHSLGGIAAFELLLKDRPANVKGLITAGSQVPLLYELGALEKLGKKSKLPADYLPWLNLYDENDVLSYRADPVFGCKVDVQVDSMLPPLHAHSGYWKSEQAWKAMLNFIQQIP